MSPETLGAWGPSHFTTSAQRPAGAALRLPPSKWSELSRGETVWIHEDKWASTPALWTKFRRTTNSCGSNLPAAAGDSSVAVTPSKSGPAGESSLATDGRQPFHRKAGGHRRFGVLGAS